MDKLRFILLFAVVLLAGNVAAYDFESDGFYYNIIDKDAKTVEVTCQENLEYNTRSSYTGDVVIPSTVNYEGVTYKVTKIGRFAFYYSDLTSLVIPEGVEEVADNGCDQCYRLASIKYPSTLKKIGQSAFCSCNAGPDIILPEGLESIGNYAFSWSNSNKLVLPSTLKSIGERAFTHLISSATIISYITEPFEINKNVFAYEWNEENGVETMSFSSAMLFVPDGSLSKYQSHEGWSTFANIWEGEPKETVVEGLRYLYTDKSSVAKVIAGDYSSLENVIIPATVTINGSKREVKEIGSAAFRESSSLRTLVIENGIEKICSYAFQSCWGLQSVVFPMSLKTIEEEAFNVCAYGMVIDLPEGLESIGHHAFNYNNSAKIVLPSTLKSIGEYAFTHLNNSAAVISHIQEPFEIPETAFAYETKWDETTNKQVVTPNRATLYVPEGTSDKYNAIEGWKNVFGSIVEGDPKDVIVGDLRYSYDEKDKTAIVIDGDYSTLESVTIPGSVQINGETFSVKEVGARAFYQCYSMLTLIIEDGVEIIGSEAFANCGGLKSIQFPTSLRTIDEMAFRDCGRGFDIILPEGLESIGQGAFNYSNSSRVELPSTLKSIGDNAFVHLSKSATVVSRIKEPFEISKYVFAFEHYWVDNEELYTTIQGSLYVPEGTSAKYKALEGWNVFGEILEGEPKEAVVDGIKYLYSDQGSVAKVAAGDYSDLETVTIPGSVEINGNVYAVTEIGGYAFNECSRIRTVTIADGVALIDSYAFQGCYNLSSVQFPSTLKTIGNNAFQSCGYGMDIILPEGLESVGEFAFNWNNSSKIVLPSTLKSIGNQAFFHPNNSAIVISHIVDPFEINTNTFAYDGYWDGEKSEITPIQGTLFVPEGTIAKYRAIEGWNMFAEILEGEPQNGTSGGFNYTYVPSSKVATLVKGDYSSIRNVTVPSKVTFDDVDYDVVSIGTDAFQMTEITSLRVSEGVKTIGNRAFRECYALKTLALPSTIIKIGDEAFAYDGGIDNISIPENVEDIGRDAFRNCKIKDLVIPVSTKSIGEGAFDEISISSIRVVAGNNYYDSRNNSNALIETASNKLIKACSATIIPNTVAEIGANSFANVNGVASFSIPNSVTSIGYGAFRNCKDLESITISSSVADIGSGVFQNCQSLISISVDPNNSIYDSRNNCNAIIETNTNTLIAGCSKTVIPRGIKTIGNEALWGCNLTDSLKIPYGVETIDGYSLSNNVLTYIEIPNSVKSLGKYIFQNNYNLVSIVSKIKDPSLTYVDYEAFDCWYNYNYDYLYENATLYVPKGKKSLYEKADGWSKFKNIVEMDGEQLAKPSLSFDGRYITATSPDKDADLYYSLDGGEPTTYYEGPVAVHDLVTVKAFAEKSFASDSEIATYDVEYLYDGDTLKLARAGMMADAIKWCSTDSIEKMTVVGPINSSEFETIRGLGSLKFLNLADAKIDGLAIPDNAFANTSLVSFVAPTELNSVGSGIFSGCQQLAAVSWTTNKTLPDDALSDVNNPNLLLYLNSSGTAPSSVRNVIKGGVAEKITLSDDTGNNNFYCPVAFTAKSISYTRNFQQKTEVGVSRGWETIVLPFNVETISHETNGILTPFASYYGSDSQRPFWLFRLEHNGTMPASEIMANVPYLICMPNDDVYGDQYIQAGNVTFSAVNVDVEVSKPVEQAQGNIAFTPTYQRVAASADIFALNVNQEYKGYPAGSLFVNNFREVRPFEAYSVHPSQAKAAGARMITVSSLIGGGDDTTGIIDIMLKKNDGTSDVDAVIKVYSLSGALVKQGRAEEVTKSLPKGIYIANGKKFVVK